MIKLLIINKNQLKNNTIKIMRQKILHKLILYINIFYNIKTNTFNKTIIVNKQYKET